MATAAAAPVSGPWSSEQLILCTDEEVGLHGVIAIDDTTLGPGLGGIRFKDYPSTEAGIRECRRLAAGMTLKNAVAELPYGGAKSVIFADRPIADRAALMRRFGDFVARTGGAYLPGVDMGTGVGDLALIGERARVSCATEDPSRWTALGVQAAIAAVVRHVDGADSLHGVRILVQGVGHVGAALVAGLRGEGAEVLVADVDPTRARATGCEVVAPEAVVTTACDVYAPCAQAGVLDAHTIEALRCRMVAGAANDVLAEPADAERLAARGIAYVPDFVANAGGVIDIHALEQGWDEAQLRDAILAIGGRTSQILAEAVALDETTVAVAEARAARRLAR